MINILDLCSGKWEREEMGGDFEWEVVCTGWNPNAPDQVREPDLQVALRLPSREVSAMPAELLDLELDEYLARMQSR